MNRVNTIAAEESDTTKCAARSRIRPSPAGTLDCPASHPTVCPPTIPTSEIRIVSPDPAPIREQSLNVMRILDGLYRRYAAGKEVKVWETAGTRKRDWRRPIGTAPAPLSFGHEPTRETSKGRKEEKNGICPFLSFLRRFLRGRYRFRFGYAKLPRTRRVKVAGSGTSYSTRYPIESGAASFHRPFTVVSKYISFPPELLGSPGAQF
jgi:hypothetical protein